MDPRQKHSRVFYGWYIVIACIIITLYTHGTIQFGFTAIFEPIAEEFGWSYASISLASSLRGLEVGLLAPVIGLLVDRWGPRRLIFGGSIVICGGLLLLSRVSSLVMFYGAFALIAIGMSTCTGTVFMATVINWFHRKSGLAIGIVGSGAGLAGLMVPVLTKLIDILQWRTAMATVGLGVLIIVLPLSLLFRHKPEHYGYEPDGEVSSVAKTKEVQVSTATAGVYVSARQAIRKRVFWHLTISAICQHFALNAVITHMMPYLSSLGITRSVSSFVSLVLPFISIGGRLGSGWLGDRFGRKQVAAVSFLLMTTGLLFFGYVTPQRIWLIVPFIITLSLGWGFNNTTRITLLRDYFGRGSFGTILGFLSGIAMIGNISGAPLAGLVFDTWGSYQGAWLGFSVLTLLGAVLMFTIPSSSGPATQKEIQL